MRDYKVILDNVKKILGKFLKEHGGYSNGLDTYVKGSVRFNSISALDWKTPKIGDMTLNKHHAEGYRLASEIAQYLKDADYRDWIFINSYAIEHGCYNTSVSVHISEDIDRNDFR